MLQGVFARVTSPKDILDHVLTEGPICLLIDQLGLETAAEFAAYAAGLSRASTNHPWIQRNIKQASGQLSNLSAQDRRLPLRVVQGGS